MAQASPSLSWLEIARKELVAAYEALGDDAQAARFRAELGESSP